MPVVGLAKRLEEVWIPGDEFPLILPRTSEALYLLQYLRDESHRFAITKHRKLKYDDVMTGQRETIYAERRKVLEGEDMGPQLRSFAESLVTGLVDEGDRRQGGG